MRSISSSHPEALSLDPLDPPRNPRRTSHWAMLAVLVLVLVPLGWVGVPREISHWYLASAQTALDEDLVPLAAQRLEASLNWYPQNVSALLLRAQLNLRNGQPAAALRDAEHAVETEGEAGIAARMFRPVVYQCLGEHQKALQDCDAVVQFVSQDQIDPRIRPELYARALNHRAYSRALAKKDLEAGLKDIEMALTLTGPSSGYLDTRGYLLFLLGRHEQALADLEDAVQRAEADWTTFREKAQALKEPIAGADRSFREMLAVLYQHRGWAYEQLGKAEGAARDLERAKEYGYDPARGIW